MWTIIECSEQNNCGLHNRQWYDKMSRSEFSESFIPPKGTYSNIDQHWNIIGSTEELTKSYIRENKTPDNDYLKKLLLQSQM